jgi:osmoprotectant transport system permease protein
MLEHDLRHEGTGLQVAAPLQLEDVAFGADHRAIFEALQQVTRRGCRHEGSLAQLAADSNYRTIAAHGEAMETLAFILHNLPAIGERTLEHLSIVSVAVGFAIVTGVPLGIVITQSQRVADTVLYLGSIVMTIPSIALFGVLIPILSKIGQGIGWLPAVIAAMLYAQLPIIRNTYTAIRNVDPALHSAAIGMGMSALQRLGRVEIPIALPVIIAGIRIAVVINIGVTAIAAYIGAGGLGTFISRGISQSDIRQLITGALALALLAIAADYSLLWLQKRLTPKGLATRTQEDLA